MEQSLLRNCPQCGDPDYEQRLLCQDHTVSGEKYPVVSCTACGFWFTNPVPHPDHIARYYKAAAYISHSDTRSGLVAKLYHQVRRFALKQKLALLEREAGTGMRSILDYGCGTGAFLRVCKAAGWEVCGVEPDADARARVGEDIVVGEALDALETRKYQVITLWHVLEHVYDLRQLLAAFRERLVPGGLMVVAVPNHRSFDAAIYGQHWAAYDVPRHLSHFDRDSMGALMQSNGFHVEQVLPMYFDSYYVSLLSEKYKGTNSYFRAVLSGLRSNRRARKDGEYSSLIYLIRRSH